MRVRDRVQERGHELGASATHIVPNLPIEGIGITELAGRLRMSLQRTGQLVKSLEDAGYVKRIADPADGRAKRVMYTARGRRLVAELDEIMDEITEELVDAVGKRRFDQFRGVLADLDNSVNGEDAPLRLSER
jgi:DNA-binding MarR family transcriptional regulator